MSDKEVYENDLDSFKCEIIKGIETIVKETDQITMNNILIHFDGNLPSGSLMLTVANTAVDLIDWLALMRLFSVLNEDSMNKHDFTESLLDGELYTFFANHYIMAVFDVNYDELDRINRSWSVFKPFLLSARGIS